jgi:uroporphyrinogen-III decarboxylase
MSKINFSPDYTNVLQVLHNERPKRLPLYEHHIDLPFINKCLGRNIFLEGSTEKDYKAYYSQIIDFWKEMTYDAFDFEAGVCNIFPGHGAITGGMLGPIQTREDFDRYPWDELPSLYWTEFKPHLDAIRAVMPKGMKAYGGCGYGIFEASQDLVGFEPLCLMQYMDPELFDDLFHKIGDLYQTLWTRMVAEYSDIFVFFRMGDDLGHKTSTMLEPDTIRTHILPQYKKVIDTVHAGNKKFLLHSCGCIFDVMDDILALGIDAKHSNEDQIAPFEKWIENYSNKIGLFGGFDLNTLILNNYDEVYRKVLEKGTNYRNSAKGYGLGSGNSIPGYIPVEGFQAMIDAVNEIRRREE